MTTNERIKGSIKKNVARLIPDAAKEYTDQQIEVDLLRMGCEMVDMLNKDLATVDTKAGDDERQKAGAIIEQMIAKQIVVELKKKYNIK